MQIIKRFHHCNPLYFVRVNLCVPITLIPRTFSLGSPTSRSAGLGSVTRRSRRQGSLEPSYSNIECTRAAKGWMFLSSHVFRTSMPLALEQAEEAQATRVLTPTSCQASDGCHNSSEQAWSSEPTNHRKSQGYRIPQLNLGLMLNRPAGESSSTPMLDRIGTQLLLTHRPCQILPRQLRANQYLGSSISQTKKRRNCLAILDTFSVKEKRDSGMYGWIGPSDVPHQHA